MKTNSPGNEQIPNHKQFTASSMGSIAFEAIQQESEGIIFGVTSRGIFIKTSSRWLIFISYEPHHGPLTINVPDARNVKSCINNKIRVRFASGQIHIPDAACVINTHNALVWRPKPPAASALPAAARRERLVAAAQKIISRGPEEGLSVLLPPLLKTTHNKEFYGEEFPPLFLSILDLAHETGELPSPKLIVDLLGTGPGLTPSGDDFVMGMLLAVNRWEAENQNQPNLDLFNREIVAAAYQQTTTLSANLIECAAQGLADQCLIDALDWLVSGSESDMQSIDALLTWGSSSGSDVFVGYVVALSSKISP